MVRVCSCVDMWCQLWGGVLVCCGGDVYVSSGNVVCLCVASFHSLNNEKTIKCRETPLCRDVSVCVRAFACVCVRVRR